VAKMCVQQSGAKLRSEIEGSVNGWKQMWKFCLCKEGVLCLSSVVWRPSSCTNSSSLCCEWIHWILHIW